MTSPAYRPSATSRDSSAPIRSIRSQASTAVAAAAGLGLVWTTVTRADRAPARLPFEVAESVIDVVRRTDEADVAAVLKEDDDGRWQVSVRSKGTADVGRACVALGGGGHALAAGFTGSGTAADVMTALRSQLAAAPSEPKGRGAVLD